MSDKNRHEKIKKVLKIAGICTIVIGAAFAITGFVSFFKSFASGDAPSLFWCCFVGLPLIAAGAAMASMGFRREITGYIKNETVPVINEAGKEITPAVSSIANAARKENDNVCPVCGKPNDEDVKFCRHCGAPLYVTCPACGKTVKRGTYCGECGAKLE